MKETKHCPTCNAKMMEYRHVMNSALATGLDRLRRVGGKANLKTLGLTRNQWDNFQKLRYWDFVRQVEVEGVRKRGVWEITHLGREFLHGVPARKACFTYRGEFQRWDGSWTTVDDLLPGYRKRPEYAADAVDHQTDMFH